MSDSVAIEGSRLQTLLFDQNPMTSYEIALQAYESDDYQQALAVLDGGAERAYAIVEGYE